MTTLELSNEFDILYDNIASKGAPGIDLYEKSVYLTTAQLEIIKNYYNPKSNRFQDGFEKTEKRRVDLKELIRNYKSTSSIISDEAISPDSKFFNIPSDVMFIIQEQVVISSEKDCNNGKIISVIPKTHDEYNIQINNPFKKPSISNAWRMDYYSQLSNNVELISPFDIKEYQLRYIKYPQPIILTDLTSGDFTGMNLSIDGLTQESTSELNKEIHKEILNRAVELATRDYKENNLQNKIQTNLRNE